MYPQVYIGNNVTIGENCILYPGVKIYDGCKIGNNCIFHANVVIGSDGFGFAPRPDGSYKKIPQTGIVTIEDTRKTSEQGDEYVEDCRSCSGEKLSRIAEAERGDKEIYE